MGKFLSHTPEEQDDHPSDSDERPKYSTSSGTILKRERQRRDDIKHRLQELYGQSGAEKYHHLEPEYSVDQSPLNDVDAMCSHQQRSVEFRPAMQAETEVVVKQHWVERAAHVPRS